LPLAASSASFSRMCGKVGGKASSGQGPHGPEANRPQAKPHVTKPIEPMRVAKAIAHAGLCSRRDAERMIGAGRVAVNGKVLTTPAYVVSVKDRITVDGKVLPQVQAPRLFRYHKPRGLVTSHKDPRGRKTVFEALPEGLPRVVSVGRLDINTEGLLLLTTDGQLARHLELPSTGWLRRYRVRAHGRVTEEALDKLRQGITIEGVRYGPVEARIDREQGANLWLTLGLREGKNREVKRLAEHLGLTVNRLIRVSFGPFALGDLPEGAVEAVKPKVLADQIGRKFAAELGLLDAIKERRKARHG
jgi:23S rRNA pseudouridine2605 synthase